MEFIRNRYLLVPFLVVFLTFCLDKLLLLENVHTYFSKSLSDINYIQKRQLYEDLKVYLSNKDRDKVLVYFGNSRALLFDNEYIHKKYSGWVMFNFSVPGGKPDYVLQWMEEFHKDNVKPDFFLFDHSVEMYNSAATLKVDETLTNGLNVSFVLKHFSLFSTDDISTLIAKRMFRAYQYRPKLEVILTRAKNKESFLYPYRELRNSLMANLNRGKGSAMTPGTHQSVLPPELLKKSAIGDFHSYLVPFRFSENILSFTNQSLELAKQLGVPTAVIWVRLSLPYMDHIRNLKVSVGDGKEDTVYHDWYPRMVAYHKQNGVPFWNMNDDPNYTCNNFSDAGHMSPTCYDEYTDYIFKNLLHSFVKGAR
ncbi:DUF1574 domain-containing protein [Leptospira bandrabouensis]|uniref:DUF1574 domain-containing protein n=1 Tax=Leptospira bandrabouensis TaxID=2484903 RepID=UPI001EE8C7E0|nr:DUF1574 domain-containing protein [Leptospira bandrabouensis]MCG6159132.1 DUF1574 domain-containing protein [Leptospira bandrabouensis]MCG6163066.1 DUF1574 domain-containing protein [Leptospira bandrabouensis]